MPIYNNTTKVIGVFNGTTEVKKVYNGTTPIYAKLTVTMNEQGGSSVSDKTVYYRDTYGTMPTPTKSNYEFDGWFTAASGGAQISSGVTVIATDDHTLYAQWSADPVIYATDPVYEYNSQTELVYAVYNNNPFSVTCYFEENDSTPDANSITIPANSQQYAVLDSLNPGTYYTVYFRFYADGNYSSVVSKYHTTQSAGPTDWSFVGSSLSGTAYSYNSTASRTSYSSCPSTSSIDSWLTSSYPPGNYSYGHRIRAYVGTRGGTFCGYYWFEAQ